MRERRFLVRDLSAGPEANICGEEAHHLLHVLRLRLGDEVVVFDGLGQQYRSVLTGCESDRVTARKLEALPVDEPRLDLVIAVALPKGDKMSLIVEKLTELGVRGVIPLLSTRTDIGSMAKSSDRILRWRRVALEACKQSGRARLPQIEEPTRYEEFLARDLPLHRLLACPGGDRLPAQPSPPSCVAAVGPEGGWTDDEISAAKEKGFRTMGLGPSILRTETAAIATGAILLWQWGDPPKTPV